MGTISFSISKGLIGQQNIANMIKNNQIIINYSSGSGRLELVSNTDKKLNLND